MRYLYRRLGLRRGKKGFLGLIFLLLNVFPLLAQTNLTVDLDDPVYLLIEMAELGGILSRISQIRPFPLSQVKTYLQEIDAHRNQLSDQQKKVLDEQQRRFGLTDSDKEEIWWKTGRVTLGGQGTKMEKFPMQIRGQISSYNRVAVENKAFQTVNPLELFWEGDVGPLLSYSFNVGVGPDFTDPDAFAPFTHTTYGDGFQLTLGAGLKDVTKYKGFALSFHFKPELTAQFWDNKLRFSWGRFPRSMGMGSAGLTLSQKAQPYDALELSFRPAPWMNYYFSVGSLGNWFTQNQWFKDQSSPPSSQSIDEKNLSLQVLELMPFDWFALNFSTGVVWSKRTELSYLNPLLPLLFSQNLYGDADNIALELSASFLLPLGFKIYGTLFADEMQLHKLGSLFTSTSQQFAFQTGLKGLIPGLSFTLATLQYTKLEPYVYTHYEQVYPSTSAITNTSWTHDRYNLGYPLPPNSDEFLLQIETLPIKALTLRASYRYIRHGYGDWDQDEIEGTTNSGGAFNDDTALLDNGRHAYRGRKKNFLEDGPYERIHIMSLAAEYQFPQKSLAIGLEYSFSSARNDRSDTTGYNPYSAYLPYSGTQNTLAFFLRIFPEY